MKPWAFAIKDSNGNVIGRACPCKAPREGVATTQFNPATGLRTLVYGPATWEAHLKAHSWTLEESYLTVVNVTLKDDKVKVTLLHNNNPEWNQVIEVPFSLKWNDAVRDLLFQLNKKNGCEVFINNFSSMIV
jgi:hypothetical protein